MKIIGRASGFAVLFAAAAAAATVTAAAASGGGAQDAQGAAEKAATAAAYAPMAPFANLVGKTWRGEGAGPDGKPVVDIARWEFILGGRALQTTHRLENGTYGGRTIFFYDEAAKEYVHHYFTTAGFHTTGTAQVTERGFVATERVIGHPKYAVVNSEIIIEDGVMRTLTSHIDHDGKASPAVEGFVYREIADPGPLFWTEAGSDVDDKTPMEKK
ncbi:MAG: hypothetical protein AAFY22_10525 [Pseudomonadota bacterium]